MVFVAISIPLTETVGKGTDTVKIGEFTMQDVQSGFG